MNSLKEWLEFSGIYIENSKDYDTNHPVYSYEWLGVPSEIKHWKYVRYLNGYALENIEYLPRDFFTYFYNLKHLQIPEKLKYFPDSSEFIDCKLQTIDFTYSHGINLPDSFVHLNNLKNITLIENVSSQILCSQEVADWLLKRNLVDNLKCIEIIDKKIK